jgi:hypothetical protein
MSRKYKIIGLLSVVIVLVFLVIYFNIHLPRGARLE